MSESLKEMFRRMRKKDLMYFGGSSLGGAAHGASSGGGGGGGSEESGEAGGEYDAAIAALSPSAYWKLDEAHGSTSFADSSVAGVGGSLSIGGTGVIAGNMSLIANKPTAKSLSPAGLGHLKCSSGTPLDFGAQTAFSVAVTCSFNGQADFQVIWSKRNASNVGVDLLKNNDGTAVLRLSGTGAVSRSHTITLASSAGKLAGIRHIIISQPANWTTSPTVYQNGVACTVVSSGTAPTGSTMTTTEPFAIGARAGDNAVPFEGLIQSLAFWHGTALSTGQMAGLWTAHDNPTNRLPFILDTDGGASDRGDIIDVSQVIALHVAKLIDLKAIIVTGRGDQNQAPAVKRILDYMHASVFTTAGLDQVLVGAYQGSDIVGGAGASDPSDLIVNAAGAPYDAQTGADYTDAISVYGTVLSAASANSVVISLQGHANAVEAYCAASGANLTAFNSKVKYLGLTAGQWPNSSDAASPAGTCPAATAGEYNIGATGAGDADMADAFDYIVDNVTVPTYWCGVEVCGGTHYWGSFAHDLLSQTPGASWNANNPVRVAMNGTYTRTAWDQLGTLAHFGQATVGSGGGFCTVNDIAVPAISSPLGHNTSSAGSSNHHYFSLKTSGALTEAQTRTALTQILNALHMTDG
jgi:hypothetical protein